MRRLSLKHGISKTGPAGRIPNAFSSPRRRARSSGIRRRFLPAGFAGVTVAVACLVLPHSRPPLPGGTGKARLDTLTKTKRPELVQQEFTIEPSGVAQTQKLYPAVQLAIRAGHFLPSRSSNLCSRKYCSFWRRCQDDFGGRVSG
jgi:hypothetical protein